MEYEFQKTNGSFGASIQKLSMDALDTIEELYQGRRTLTGLATGFPELDKMTSGLEPGEMIVIAACSSMGKTALAMNIVEHAAVHARKAVAVYSLEMKSEQFVLRMLCSMARVNMQNIRKAPPNTAAFASLIEATQILCETRLFIDDTPSFSIVELRSNARRLKAREGIDLIFIDYLQLMRSPSRRRQEDRQLEVAEISAGIKALAKELKVPVILLAQLNRNPDSRADGTKEKPRLSDFREFGSIEQNADIVGLLWSGAIYVSDAAEREVQEGEAGLEIAKHRNGPVGCIPLTFLKDITRFETRADDARR